MNTRDKNVLFESLSWDSCNYTRLYPRSVTKDIFLAMLDKNPDYSILIFSKKPGITIRETILGRIVKAKKRAKKKILDGSYGSSMTDREYQPGLMGRIKKFLAKHGEVIYGSSMFGQVHTDDMTEQDAAMWLAPRLSQMRNERLGYVKTVGLLKNSGKFRPEMIVVDKFTKLIRAPRLARTAHEGVSLFFRR